MFPPENPSGHHQPKRHNGKFCSFSNRQRIVNALAAGDPKYLIARALHVSEHTVYAVAEQEWQKVAERKARIAAQAERAATKAFERINQKLDSEDDIPLNQLTITGGVCVDKLLALRSEPAVTARIEHVNIPNIFEAFRQFHDDTLKIINARKAQHPPIFPALPDSPPTPPDPTQ
jgi:hypothetical protein